MDQRHHFYHWTTTEGRLEELRNRITAWGLSEDYGSHIWSDAFRIFQEKMNAADDPLELSSTALLECFEEALDTADHISSEVRMIDSDGCAP